MKFQTLQVAAFALLQAFAVHAYNDAAVGANAIKKFSADASYVTVDVEDLNDCLDKCDNGSTSDWDRCRTRCDRNYNRATPRPTPRPTRRPNRDPTRRPTRRPNRDPTRRPTRRPNRDPTRRPTRRPSGPSQPSERECTQGMKDGQEEVRQAWRNNGQNCDDVWSVENEANRIKERKFPRNSGNWRTETYNECARRGVDDEVGRIEKECLEDDSSQCTDLGNAAAELVVMDNFCTPDSDRGDKGRTDYKRECKKAAYRVCEGNIPNVADRWCPDKNMSTSKLSELQDKCRRQVNSMVGGNDAFAFME
eukprot:CAMPEP_0201944986 /NCGR_PEP_ID=MMETSP0903-20130614/53672_1 /ASSEMBLY_ACC=CAM_ASM_000552 /TAXON_ID=420261 /ORGANISM="Thalassiosira antarctica, Strain CCMP982" /LENGTH=306 /DNA_ID=CAMNT_0048488043 /DNA_START=136 /DNA_END=1056 /DNA_ORIENTATION=-